MRNFRSVTVQLALAAMLLRALLPAGWMPSAEAGAPLVICTMHGAMQIAPEPAKHKAAGEICPFAAAAALAPAGKPPALALPQAIQAFATPLADRTVAALPARREPQSPRAPPRLV
jgi:hypothetical protein